jgi:hypothetical protein
LSTWAVVLGILDPFWSRSIALYFNVFVLVVQLFEKVPAIHALAPTQTEAPFKIVQLLLLILFITFITAAARKFRPALA